MDTLRAALEMIYGGTFTDERIAQWCAGLRK